MHLPSHVRQSLLVWIDSGFPELATVEAGYSKSDVPAADMLRRFVVPVACSDRVPADYAKKVAARLGYDRPFGPMSFAMAASAMLTALAAGQRAGHDYLEAALTEDRERRLFGPPAEEWWARLSDEDRQQFMAATLSPTMLSFDLADKLRAAGVTVTYGSWGDEPWYPVWPLRILRYAADMRHQVELEAAPSGTK